ncbi:hypothetical protein GCM10010472_22840 [Pseudonocardia halophobica]|uniref:Uncharacterized protein n=1 Tax=Pseudonocardia halophobica TaxID=29401 RepID=A0A9W6KYC4_9PSEU|nr:hypothetical protein GCM10017577_06570 [Pseudonocardia halophobica]
MPADARSAATPRVPVPGTERGRPAPDLYTAEPEPPRGVPARWVSLVWRIGAAVRAAHSSSVPF